MITFLPSSSYIESAKILDTKRLIKQRLEAAQILALILSIPNKDGNKRTGYRNHPVTKMWLLYPSQLYIYYLAIFGEMEVRDINVNPLYYEEELNRQSINVPHLVPLWSNDERLYSSHRAALLAKDYNYYSKYNWKEEPKIDYWWPDYR